MKRTNDSPPEDVLRAAEETYYLEKSLHFIDRDAFRAAVTVALKTYEQTVVNHIAEIAKDLANTLSEDIDEVEGSVALRFFAEKILKELPDLAVSEQYYPQEGDRVELTMIGDVELEYTECSNCGFEDHADAWSITTDSGHEYFFQLSETLGNLRVRILSRHEE